MSKNKRKVILIGLDGLSPTMIEKFLDEKTIPNIKKIVEQGFFTWCLPAPSTVTPTSWVTLTTGAWSGTHGIDGYVRHIKGKSFYNCKGVFSSMYPNFPTKAGQCNECRAEFIWDVANKAGKKVLTINWPGAYSSNTLRGIAINGVGAKSSLCQIDSSRHSTVYLQSAKEEKTQLSSKKISLEGELPVITQGLFINGEGVEISDKEVASVKNQVKYKISVVADSDKGYDQVIISKNGKKIIQLQVGEISPWIFEKVKVFSKSPHDFTLWSPPLTQVLELSCQFKLRLEELSVRNHKLVVFRSPIYNSWGWTQPESLGSELIETFCQYQGEDHTESGITTLSGNPFCRITNSTKFQANALAETTNYLARKYPWDLLMVYICAPDHINHQKIHGVSPGAVGYNPQLEAKIWKDFREEYYTLDQMVGAIVEANTNALVAVVSDHGGIAVNKNVWPIKALIDAGLSIYKENKQTGEMFFDEEHSKVFFADFPFPEHIYINLKGRDPYGIVQPGAEYEKIRKETIEVLRNFKDPETKESPLGMLERRENIADYIGLWGDNMGDLVYFYRPGYSGAGISSLGPIPKNKYQNWLREPIRKRKKGFSTHIYAPNAKFCSQTNAGVFILGGPGIKKGSCISQPVWTVDVIPTICYLLGIDQPAQAQGKVIPQVIKR